jgi:hypothetical protein
MLAIPFRTRDLGKNMRKSAKGRKTETLRLPMAGKVAVVVIAVGGLGCGLLSRPASIQPVRVPSARQALLPPSPVPARTLAPAPAPVPAPVLASAPQVEIQKTADAPGRLVRQVVDYVSHEAPGTVCMTLGGGADILVSKTTLSGSVCIELILMTGRLVLL